MDIPKVLIVGPSFSGGGAERRFTNIAIHLFGGECDVAVLVPGYISGHQIFGDIIQLGWSGRLSYFKAIWLLRQRILQKRYDVLIAFGLFPNVVSVIAAALAPRETKIIINEITRPKMEVLNIKGWRMVVHNKLRKWFYKKSDLITANSIDGLREACELAGVDIKHGFRVVNVIDKEYLDRKSLEKIDTFIPKRKYIICVGRLDFMKRIDTVISAFGFLGAHIECDLVIVGNGEARQALESQVSALGLDKLVLFTGRLDNPFPLLKAASVFVLASEYEGYSNSVLEAMFCDVPVITSFCSSDAREMCNQGAALGFDVGDITQLSKHIAAVVTDEALGQKMVSRAREYCAPHGLKQAISIYEELIRQVARSPIQESNGINQ